MQIHFLPVLVCAIISMILGGIWYGPLFGKAWMRILKVDPECLNNPEKKKAMQKQVMPLYLVQFGLSIVTLYTLAYYIANSSSGGLTNALIIWTGFIVPTIAGGCMWNNDSRKIVWQRFFIQVGYQYVLFVVAGLILTMWR